MTTQIIVMCEPPADAAAQQPGFPLEDSLCEGCGYSLRGLTTEANCPECGRPVNMSRPQRRIGLPWQRGMSVRQWLGTWRLMVFSPNTAFEQLRLDRSLSLWRREAAGIDDQHKAGQSRPHSNARDRLFLLSVAAISVIIFVVTWRLMGYSRGWFWWWLSAVAVVGMTYMEAVGVTWVAWRRGWRVPWPTAERIACYASIGWLPAMFIMAPLIALYQHAPALPVWARWLPMRGDYRDWLWMIIVAGITILWFETLVWLGVRKLRFANVL